MKKKKNNKKKGVSTNIVVNDTPKSSYAEAIRSIRTNLKFSSVNRDVQTILITSPEPSDGKSFTASNLAVAYAQEGKKVLIVDCDLRRGIQHKIFSVHIDSDRGYSNLILDYDEYTSIYKYIIKTDIKNVSLLPIGPVPPNPIELLSSDNNRRVMKELKREFDIIILDCPPVLGLSDALVLTKYSDVNVVVATFKKTKIEKLKEVKSNFEKVNSKITGVILNKVPNTKSSYYYYGYY